MGPRDGIKSAAWQQVPLPTKVSCQSLQEKALKRKLVFLHAVGPSGQEGGRAEQLQRVILGTQGNL